MKTLLKPEELFTLALSIFFFAKLDFAWRGIPYYYSRLM